MEFRFNINNLLPKRINKITHTLIPEGFRGDRREYNDCQRLLTRILDDMGEASAKAQGLNRTITSALKLRDTDHIIYLMVDSEGNNGLGTVIGLLKTGSKTLFMFDENGYNYQIKPRCILDFYVHETQQRKGLGNELYQFMLAEENLKPIKLAIDRPSDKFLAFLKKYYGLVSIIPQNNKFVVFKGFFDDEVQDAQLNRYPSPLAPNQKTNEYRVKSSNDSDILSVKDSSINGTPVTRSAYGRYAASRPPCSMGSIIHSAISEPTERPRSAPIKLRTASLERPASLNLQTDESIFNDISDEIKSITTEERISAEIVTTEEPPPDAAPSEAAELSDSPNNPNLLPDSNDQCIKDEIDNEDACTTATSKCFQEAAGHPTNGGHLDLKFYHSPLW